MTAVLLGRRRRAAATTWCSRNTTRGLAATLTTLVIAFGALSGRTAEAAGAPGGPNPADVVSAFLTLEGWVRSFSAPSLDDQAAAVPITDASAVLVLLRHRGRILGTGVDVKADSLMVRRAAGRALVEVLASPSVANLPEDRRDRVGRSLSLELAASGPLVALAGRTFADIAAQLEPGLDGVALLRDDAVGILFPEQIRATNRADDLARRLPAVAVDLGLPALELGELWDRFGVRAYRFRTLNLVQKVPGGRPMETVRGQIVVRPDEVNDERIYAFGTGIVDHLIMALWAHEEALGVMGDYRPMLDRYEPIIAPARDQALAAYALARWASVLSSEDSSGVRAKGAAQVILTDLGHVTEGELDPFADPATCAAIVLAWLELGDLGDAGRPLIDNATMHVIAASKDPAVAETVTSAHSRAIVAAAAARLYAVSRLFPPAVARTAIDNAWDGVAVRDRVSLMPWIVTAEQAMQNAGAGDPARRNDLLAMRTVIEASQVTTDMSSHEDLMGGILLRGQGGRLRATAQTTRPGAGYAMLLREADLFEPIDRKNGEARLRSILRFLMQLQIDADMLWAVPNPPRAKGGIRASTWNWDQPLAAQALALLTAAEATESLGIAPERP